VAYLMARLPMTLSDAEGHFCCFKPSYYKQPYPGNIACLNYSVFTQIAKHTWLVI